jgi:hypothetical protein
MMWNTLRTDNQIAKWKRTKWQTMIWNTLRTDNQIAKSKRPKYIYFILTPGFSGIRFIQYLVFCVVYSTSLFVILFFFIWRFDCLSVVYSTSLFVILFFFIWPFDCLYYGQTIKWPNEKEQNDKQWCGIHYGQTIKWPNEKEQNDKQWCGIHYGQTIKWPNEKPFLMNQGK